VAFGFKTIGAVAAVAVVAFTVVVALVAVLGDADEVLVALLTQTVIDGRFVAAEFGADGGQTHCTCDLCF
jgi:hypothetical protein